MNKLKDAPELKAAFEKAGRDFGLLWAPDSYRITAEHFFIAGRDSLRDECDSVKPKRTIAELITSPQGRILVKSNDGKLFTIDGFDRNGGPLWIPYPDLPQD